MSKLASYDELNIRDSDNRRSEPYSEYFGKMEISEDERQIRIIFSEDMEEVILYILVLAETMIENDEVDSEYLKTQLHEKYLDVVSGYLVIDSYIKQYASELSKQIIDTTLSYGIKNDDKSVKKVDEYYFSNDRAMFISECEANTVLNYKEYSDALKSGKKYKTWVDVRDKRERKTHLEVGGTTIPIKESFSVGGSLMMFPKDTSLGASSKEIVNCRCSIRYS